MIGLSSDIEAKIQNMLEGMVLDINVYDVNDTKIHTLVNSRIQSFNNIKQSILSWQNSPNAPSHEKLKTYIIELVQAGEMSVEVLRDALRKPIDFTKLKPEDYGTATSSTPVILKAISDIDAGNKELKLQIESDKFDLGDRDFKRGFPEKFANQEFYPLKNYYKNWHDKENDSVCICPKGTKGETITLDGLNITLPKKPKNTDISGHRKPKEQQYWVRTELPKGLTPDTEEAFTDFILEEFKRRREGYWFMNNGEAVYLTGSHYFALNWCLLKDERFVGYMGFRHSQKLMFYHTEACVIDERCVGQFFVKSRRTGYTFEKLFRMLNEVTSTNQANFGITSKSDEDAKKAFKKLSFAFLNLPFFFRPVVKSKEDSDVRLEFAKPSNNSVASKKSRDTSTKDYLNSTIDYEPTKEDAYDGQAMFRYLADEASKWKRGLNFLKHWGEVSPTMDEGGDIVGKAFVGSTVAAMKDGGSNFIDLYNQSQIWDRDKITQRTPSGLYSYFLPAHHNMADYTDKYGVCHQVLEQGQSFFNTKGKEKFIGSVQFLEAMNISKKKKGDIVYNNQLRAFPMCIEDAMRDELQSSLFDIQKLNEQINHNKRHDINETLVRGNFEWENGIRDTKVKWQPNEKGKFLVGWIPPPELRNNFEMRRNTFGGSSYHPMNEEFGCFGIDPYDIDGVVNSKIQQTENGSEQTLGSRGAMAGVTGFNIGNVPSNYFFLEYITRPQTSDIFFEDCLMACVFYGMPVLIENQKARILYHFKNRGYRGFSLSRFDKPMNRLSQTERDLGGIPSASADVVNMHWTAIESYIGKYVGVYEQKQDLYPIREEGEVGSMPFNRTLVDWLHFNLKDREGFDASIASGYALMGLNRKSYAPKEKEKKPFILKLHRYTN